MGGYKKNQKQETNKTLPRKYLTYRIKGSANEINAHWPPGNIYDVQMRNNY